MMFRCGWLKDGEWRFDPAAGEDVRTRRLAPRSNYDRGGGGCGSARNAEQAAASMMSSRVRSEWVMKQSTTCSFSGILGRVQWPGVLVAGLQSGFSPITGALVPSIACGTSRHWPAARRRRRDSRSSRARGSAPSRSPTATCIRRDQAAVGLRLDHGEYMFDARPNLRLVAALAALHLIDYAVTARALIREVARRGRLAVEQRLLARVVRLDHRAQRRPRHDPVHRAGKFVASSTLALRLEAFTLIGCHRQRLLLHRRLPFSDHVHRSISAETRGGWTIRFALTGETKEGPCVAQSRYARSSVSAARKSGVRGRSRSRNATFARNAR